MLHTTLIRLQISYNTTLRTAAKIALLFVFIYVRARSCVDMCLKANIFALYIAHFAVFVLKICINLGKNILICCKTLKKQRFLGKCLHVSKYVCTFARN